MFRSGVCFDTPSHIPYVFVAAHRSWIRLCSISLTCIIFLSLFIYSSVTVLISSSLLFEPLMTSGMSEVSSNYVCQCLTPLTDSWGPPYDKYHITQLSLATQAINYPITVSNPAFVLLARAMPALNLGVHQS